jgi:hypothetical protein
MSRKGRAAISCILLGLALTSQAVIAHAQTTHPSDSQQKNSAKRYAKRQKKIQKKALKQQNKTVKAWKKRHQTG